MEKNKPNEIVNKRSNKFAINAFDSGSIIIVAFILMMAVYSLFIYQAPEFNQKIYATLKVSADNIETEALSQKTVYLNSVNIPVDVSAVRREGDFLLITLSAPGEIKDGVYIFNGQRILVNQKSEIHSTYFAQGEIVSVSNEFK